MNFMYRQDVIHVIRMFCEDDRRYAYSFGHIVLDDYNLDDDCIKFCLRQKTINDWFEHNLQSCDPASSNPESPNDWERYQYDDLTDARDKIIAFLRFLLTIPEDIREGDNEED